MRRFSDYSVRRKESGCSFPKSVSVDELRKKLTAGEVRVAGSVSGDIIKCRRKSHNARRVSWSLASTEISDADFPSYKFGNCLINPKHGDVLTNTGSGDKIFQKLSDENKAVKVAGSETDCDLGTNVIRNNEDRCDNETNLDKTQESEPDSDAEISGILANSDNYPLLAINAVNKVCPSVVTCGSCQKKSKPTSDVLVVRDKTKANVTRRSPEDGTDTIVPKYVDELERDLILGKMTKKKSEITFDQRRTSRDESKSLNLSDDVLILEQSKEPIYMNIFEERNKKLSIFEDLSEPVKTYLSRHLSCGENLDESGASETSFSRRNDSHVSGYEQEETMYRKYGDRDIKRKISEGVVPRKKSESLIKTVLKDSLTRKLSEGSRRGTASRKTSRENSRKLSEGSRRGTACRKTSREMNLEEVSGKFIDWKTLRSKTRMRKLSDTGAVHPVVEPVYANIPVNRGTELLPYRQMKYAPISSSGKAAGLASELTGDKDFVTRKMSEGLSPRKLSENLMQPLIQHSMKRKLSVGNVNRPDNYHGQFQMEIKAIEMKGNHSAGFEASYGTKQVFSKQVKGGKSIYPDQPSQDFKGAMTASTVRDVPKMYPCKGKSVARELTYGRDFGIRQPPASRLTRKSSERTTSQVVDALNTRDWPGDRNRSRVRSDSVDCRVSSNSCKRMTSPVVDNYERTTSPVVDEYERMTSPVVDDLNTRELSGDRSRIRSVTGEATRSRNTYERMMNPVVDDLNTRELSGDRSRSRIRSVIGEARMSRNSYERMIRPAVDDLNTSDLPGNSSETRVGSVSGEGRLSRKSSEQMFRPVVDELITRELSWDRSRLRSVSREGRRSRNSYDRMTSSVVDDLNTRELSGDRSRSRIRSVIGEAKMSRNSYERMIRPAVDDLNTSDLPGNSSETRVGSVSGEGRLSRKSSEQMFRPVVDELITRELSWDRSRLRSVSREGRASGNSFDRMTSPVVDDLNTRELSGDRSRIRSVTGEARSINSYERMFRPMVDELITRDSPGDRSETTRFRSVSWECGVSRNSYERMTSPVRDDLNTRELPRDRSKTRIRTVSGEARKSSERMTRPAVDDLDTRDLLGDSCRSRFRSVSREGGVSRSSYERMTRPVVDDSVFGEMAGANQRTGRVRSVSEDICRKKVSVRDLIRVFSGELETTTNSSEAVLRTPAVHSGKVTLNRFSPLIRHKFEKPRKVTSITRSSSLSPGLRKKKKSVGFLLDNSPEREFIKYPTVQNRYENTVTPVLDRRYKKLSGEARRRKTGVGLVSTNSEAGYMDMQTPLRSPVIQTNPENNEWLTWKSGPGWESPRMLRSRKICAPLGMLVRTMSGNSLTDR